MVVLTKPTKWREQLYIAAIDFDYSIYFFFIIYDMLCISIVPKVSQAY